MPDQQAAMEAPRTPELAPATRRHDLDALRAFAMLLGIALHACLSFLPPPPGAERGLWPVQDANTSGLLVLVLFGVHGFRMQAFFMMSGFFTAMLWRRRGLGPLLRHRARRIALPLAVGMVTLIPLWHAVIWMTTGRRETDIMPTLAGYVLHGPFFSHLWFLWYLIWLVLGFALVVRPLGRRGSLRGSRWVLSPLRYLWLVPLTVLPQWFMHRRMDGFGPDTAAGLVIPPHLFLYYALFFGFGAMLYDAADDRGRVGRFWWLTLPLALFAVFPAGLVFSLGGEGLDPVLGEAPRRAIAALLQSLYAWMVCFGLIGLFRRVLHTERPWVRYVSDAAYWMYLAHLVLLLWMQWLVRDWPAPALAKWLLLCVAAFAVLLGSYALLVRRTPIGILLSGRRLPARPGQGPLPGSRVPSVRSG